MTKMLVGLDVPAELSAGDPVANARRAEDLGFDFISTNDHVLGSEPRLEGWTLLTWLAASTSRIRIASRVLGVPYREPVLLAKMAESLNRLSGGRLILGLGAGSGAAEFSAMGLADSNLAERVRGLAEAVDIVQSLWTQTKVSHAGDRYIVRDAEIAPRPDRSIPIWLGTVGPRGLRLVGTSANGWIPSHAYAPPEQAQEMIAAILRAAADAGRDPDRIDRIYNLELTPGTEDRSDLVGGPAQIVEQLAHFVEVGFTGFNFKVSGPDRDDYIEQLATQVIPALRGATE